VTDEYLGAEWKDSGAIVCTVRGVWRDWRARGRYNVAQRAKVLSLGLFDSARFIAD